MTEAEGRERKTIRALTGNLYVATPAEDIEYPESEKHGLEPEYYLWPLKWINIEPAYATLLMEVLTWARECGLVEMSVRGIGIRVMATVRTPNYKIENKASAYSWGGDSITEHDLDNNYTHTIGLVIEAPYGTREENQTKTKESTNETEHETSVGSEEIETMISAHDLCKAEKGLAPARTSGSACDVYEPTLDAVVKGVVVTAAEKDAMLTDGTIHTKAEDSCSVSVRTLVVHPGYLVKKPKMTGTIGIKGKIMIIHTACLTSELVGTKIGSTGMTELTAGLECTFLVNMILELHWA